MIKSIKTAVDSYFQYIVWPVAAISFGGIAISVAVAGGSTLSYSGVAGCLVSSFILAIVAFFRDKKDIVSLMAPIYALLIFNPYSEFTTGVAMQTLYAATISVMAVRLMKRF